MLLKENRSQKFIRSRSYLLEMQRVQIIKDLTVAKLDLPDGKYIECSKIMDSIFYRLFGKGWDDLTMLERQDILYIWRDYYNE